MTTTLLPITPCATDGPHFAPVEPSLSVDAKKLIDDIKAGKVQFKLHPMESDPLGIDQHAPGAKLDSGKQLAGVLLDFSRALEAVADVGTFGANKYTRGGWQSVPDSERRYTDALMRHLLKMQREELDPDSGLEHLAHLAWNCLAVLELKRRAA